MSPAAAAAAAAPPGVEEEPSVLGVESSATGRRWVSRGGAPELADAIARRLGAPEALGRVLAARGVGVEDAEAFLHPTLRAEFPDPSSFADMDAAVAVLSDALASGRKMAVFADYDVDGATSAALLIRYFRARGADLDLYVPDRIEEGYGPSGPAFAELKRRGVELVVTVDCGAMAHEALDAARAIDLEVVVLDHHQMTAAPPEAAAVVNPNRADCGSGCGHLAAAGVTYVLLAALNREARRRGAFKSKADEPDILALLDLAALGTVCDVVPLRGVNRAIVAQGLKIMSSGRNPGLAALGAVAGAKDSASVYAAGFVYGPRINAGGRVGRADMGARLLSTDDETIAQSIANELDGLNRHRREIEQAVLEAAIAQVESSPGLKDASVIVTAGAGWHPGVIGIVAGRLKERYGRPTVVIGLPGEAEDPAPGKGSGRSIPGVDLGAAVAAAREAGLLINGGGHAMAAGLTVTADKVADVAAFLAAHVEASGASLVRTLSVDAVVAGSGMTRALAESVQAAGPFGAGNPEPVFAAADLRIVGAREVGTGHLKTSLEDAGGARVEAIAFRAADTGLYDALARQGEKVAIAAKVKPGRGRFVDIHIEDAASCAS